MRYRFVSNSSSASFFVNRTDVTEEEIRLLLAYNLSEDNTDGWVIEEIPEGVRGYTSMDNDALDEYLEKIEFDVRKMQWSEDY